MNGPLTIDGCATVPQLFWKRVTDWGPRVALREKDFGIWNETSLGRLRRAGPAGGLGAEILGP